MMSPLLSPRGNVLQMHFFRLGTGLRLALLHSIRTAASIAASCSHGSTPPSASSSSYSHLTSKMALKTVISMIHHDWVKCNDDVRQISGVCSSWLRGKDASMTLDCFLFWCALIDTASCVHAKGLLPKYSTDVLWLPQQLPPLHKVLRLSG